MEAGHRMVIGSGEASPSTASAKCHSDNAEGFLERVGKAHIAGRSAELSVSLEQVAKLLSYETVAGGFERRRTHIEN